MSEADSTRSYFLAEMRQPEAEHLLREAGLVILPVGSVEQHGPHLPLGTDAFAALAVAQRVAARLKAPILPGPMVGVAPYHLPWIGTLTLRPSTLQAVLVDLCAPLPAAGVKRLLIINWHEGNTPTVRQAAQEIQEQHGLRVLVAETHIITNQLFPDEMEFTHCGAMETSAVLAYDPTLVDLAQAREGATDLDRGNRGHALFRRRDVFPIMRDFREVAPTGWYGHPERATPERAREIFNRVADHVVTQMAEVFEALEALRPDGAESAAAAGKGS
ncbi:MAG: creatininase family protein [Chloroflexi bacterium]|nr:creatininase family protein [Chloroflexota bacterium]